VIICAERFAASEEGSVAGSVAGSEGGVGGGVGDGAGSGSGEWMADSGARIASDPENPELPAASVGDGAGSVAVPPDCDCSEPAAGGWLSRTVSGDGSAGDAGLADPESPACEADAAGSDCGETSDMSKDDELFIHAEESASISAIVNKQKRIFFTDSSIQTGAVFYLLY